MSILISKFSLENVDYHRPPTELGSKPQSWAKEQAAKTTEAKTKITADVWQLPSFEEVVRASVANNLNTKPLSNFETSSMLRDTSNWLKEAAIQLSGNDKNLVESAAQTLKEQTLEFECCNAARFAEIRA